MGEMPSQNPDISRISQSLMVWERAIYKNLCKKDCCGKEVQVQGHVSFFHKCCHDSFWPGDIDLGYLCFSLCRPAGCGRQTHGSCQRAPPGCAAGCHKERGKLGTHRDTLWMPWGCSKVAGKNSWKLFYDQFLPCFTYPGGRRAVPYFESYKKQRAMQFIAGGWQRVYLYYVCVRISFVFLLYSLISVYR